MIADAAFWRVYAIKNDIRTNGNPITAAARAFSFRERSEAVIRWPNGRETVFRDGYRLG